MNTCLTCKYFEMLAPKDLTDPYDYDLGFCKYPTELLPICLTNGREQVHGEYINCSCWTAKEPSPG